MADPQNTGLKLSDVNPEEIEVLPGGENEAKYGGSGSQAVAALERAGSAATFGLSKGAERLAGKAFGIDALSPEAIQGRDEALNPVLGIGADIAGLIGPGGIAKLAGSTALKGAAKFGAGALLEKAGLAAAEKVGLGVAKTVSQKLAAGAVKGFVEGGLFQGGNEVAKMMLSDPHQTVGTAATSIGLAGLMGAPFGAAGEGAKHLWNAKFGKATAEALEQAGIDASGRDAATSAMDSFDLTRAKPNAAEISQSFKNLKIEPTAGAISDTPFVQNMEGNLARRPTIAGAKQAAEYEGIEKTLRAGLQDVMSDAGGKSKYATGKEIKQGMIETLESELKPIEAKYKELTPHLKAIELADNVKLEAIDKIANHEFTRIDPEFETLAKKLSNRIEGAKNLNDLKNVRSLINGELTEAYRAGSPKAQILQTAKNAINDMREVAINDAAKQSGMGRGAGKIAEETINEIKLADQGYRGYKQKLMGLGAEGGLGKPRNARALLESLNRSSDESMVGKIFDLKDVNSMKFFKENFPAQFESARKLKIADMMEQSLSEAQGKNSKLEVGKVLRQLSDKKIGPEAREMLLGPDKLAKLRDIKNVFEALPANPNPSGTSYAEAFGKMFSFEGIAQNLTDAAQMAFLKAQPHLLRAASSAGGDEAAHLAALQVLRQTDGAAVPADPQAFRAMVDFMKSTIKGENDLVRATKNIFKAGSEVLPSHLLPNDRDRKNLEDRLQHVQVNPMPMMDVGDKVGTYMPDTAGAMAETTMNAVNYLNTLRPEVPKQNPLDPQLKPSSVEKAVYERALDIAEQPMIVLQDIKKGTLTSQDVLHLRNMYPALYNRMVDKLTQNMVDHLSAGDVIPYKTRMSMSVFLSQPMDQTMNPQSIQAAQPKMAERTEQAQQRTPGSGSMKNLDKIAANNQTNQQARVSYRSQN